MPKQRVKRKFIIEGQGNNEQPLPENTQTNRSTIVLEIVIMSIFFFFMCMLLGFVFSKINKESKQNTSPAKPPETTLQPRVTYTFAIITRKNEQPPLLSQPDMLRFPLPPKPQPVPKQKTVPLIVRKKNTSITVKQEPPLPLPKTIREIAPPATPKLVELEPEKPKVIRVNFSGTDFAKKVTASNQPPPKPKRTVHTPPNLVFTVRKIQTPPVLRNLPARDYLAPCSTKTFIPCRILPRLQRKQIRLCKKQVRYARKLRRRQHRFCTFRR